MTIQHSPPARQTRSQARTQAVLSPTARAPLDGTPAGRKRAKKLKLLLRSSWKFSRNFKGPGEDGEEEEENSVEEEDSDGTEGVPAPVRASQGTGGPALVQSNKPVSHESEPCLLVIMQKMTDIIPNLLEDSSYEASKPPA
ncbi:hypothetical protein O181_126713 [Austropuccinia psidii MF-1]|uniref:Uncharacterized protein n=1 Tax=Austropuccinia psidii MF-1 TaxID=1389203 RepID=A0A9Q3Q689_9BASI|nr:hypothetical protein [Austropuccinia psidii MF-1]